MPAVHRSASRVPVRLGLEHFQCQGQIQDRFGTGTDDGNVRTGQFFQIGRNIKRLLCAAVNAADAAGDEYFRQEQRGSSSSLLSWRPTLSAP